MGVWLASANNYQQSMEDTQFPHEQLMQREEVVDVRKKVENGDIAVQKVHETATGSTSSGDREYLFLSSVVAHHNVALRSPSPEYTDAVQEQQGVDMGEIGAKGEANEVERERLEGVQHLVLHRDPGQINSLSDLGIGVKVAGGVKCDKCGRLHTVITDVTDNLPVHLYRGLAVLEWCGHNVDGVSYEVVKCVLGKTEHETNVELIVKECSGPPPEVEVESQPTIQDTPTRPDSVNSMSRVSPSSSSADRDASYTPKSLSPTPSPIRSRTCTPNHSPTSTPSPSPPPSPTNVRTRKTHRATVSEPRPASINLPAFRPQDTIIRPRFMINDVPTSLPNQIVGPLKKYTIESFLGGAPSASIHMSLRYREEDNHLRLLLHEVKHHQKNGNNKSSTVQGHYFINAYLLPDHDKQGVRSCEVLSRVSDLENPQFYTITKQQLKTVALRVILWQTKSKQQTFVGEVLLSLSDSDVVRLQGLPNWFPICDTDPNLPALPTPVPVKKTKKEDIFHRVRRGTGYALQSLRRPMSMGIEALAAEGRMSPSSSIENLETSIKKLQRAHITMPRRVKKERRPLTGLFTTSPSHVPNVASVQQQPNSKIEKTSDAQNGPINSEKNTFIDIVDTDNDAVIAPLSVPTSPLLQRRAVSAGRESGRRNKLAGILNVLRGSLLPTMHSVDGRKRSATEAVDGNSNRRWSLSGEVKHRIGPLSPPLSTASSPFSSPQHRRMQQVKTTAAQSSHRRTNSAADILDYEWTDSPDIPLSDTVKDDDTTIVIENYSATANTLVMDSLTTTENSLNTALLSDSSWYSAEEELKDEEGGLKSQATNQEVTSKDGHSRSRRLYSHPEKNNDLDLNQRIKPASKKKSKSVDDILDTVSRSEVVDEGVQRNHAPLARTRCHALSHGSSSGSSVEEYGSANSRPLSVRTSSEEDPPGESSLDSSTRLKMIGRVNALSSSSQMYRVPVQSEGSVDGASSGGTAVATSVSRWRSFDNLLSALPLQKMKPKWLHRNKTHSNATSSPKQSPLLSRRSSEPAFATGPPVGKVKLELTFNPQTSMVGIRLHEHTLSDTKTDLTVETYMFPRISDGKNKGQRNIVSFKKTHYSHTLVASFHCNSRLTDMFLQVSLETSGRFFSRVSGHVVLRLGPLLLSSPSLSCNQWFPLFNSPLSPPNNAHPN